SRAPAVCSPVVAWARGAWPRRRAWGWGRGAWPPRPARGWGAAGWARGRRRGRGLARGGLAARAGGARGRGRLGRGARGARAGGLGHDRGLEGVGDLAREQRQRLRRDARRLERIAQPLARAPGLAVAHADRELPFVAVALDHAGDDDLRGHILGDGGDVLGRTRRREQLLRRPPPRALRDELHPLA